MTTSYLTVDVPVVSVECDLYTADLAGAVNRLPSSLNVVVVATYTDRIRILAYSPGLATEWSGCFAQFAGDISSITLVNAANLLGPITSTVTVSTIIPKFPAGHLIWPVPIFTFPDGLSSWWITSNPDSCATHLPVSPYEDPYAWSDGLTPPAGYESGILFPWDLDRILTSSAVSIKDTPGGTEIDTAPAGAYGVQIGRQTLDGVCWIEVDFDDYLTGWIQVSQLSVQWPPEAPSTPVVPGVPSEVGQPVISALANSRPGGGSTASVTWTTDTATISRVQYGLTTAYGSVTPYTSVYGTSQSLAISGLTPGVTYHARAVSVDSSGRTTISADFSLEGARLATKVWYVTTDNLGDHDSTQLTTLYIMTWDGASFTTIYTETSPVHGEWAEPQIDSHQRGDLRVIGLIRGIKEGYGTGVPQILVFQGETLLHNVFLDPSPGTFYSYQVSTGRWIYIDSTGVIHCLAAVVINGTDRLCDYRSTDNGETWTRIEIESQADDDCDYSYLWEDGSGNLYVALISGNIHKSTDKGLTWSVAATLPGTNYLRWFAIVNDIFFCGARSGTDILVYATSDLASGWGTPIQTFAGIGGTVLGVNFAFDGTYYYTTVSYWTIGVGATITSYRSNNWDSGWASAGSFTSLNGPPSYSQLLVSSEGNLYYNLYYGETLYPNYYLTFWESTDQATTWTPIRTPFWDVNNGSDPGGDVIPWYSCPQTILLATEAVTPAASCVSVSASINADTMLVSGSGVGLEGTQWRVIKTSDGTVMDSGSGLAATFSFTGTYNTHYQLQFAKVDNVFSTVGCTFFFEEPIEPPPEPPPPTPVFVPVVCPEETEVRRVRPPLFGIQPYLKLYRGDSKVLHVAVTELDGTPYDLSGAAISFVAKRNPWDAVMSAIVRKSSLVAGQIDLDTDDFATMFITIEPLDTLALPPFLTTLFWQLTIRIGGEAFVKRGTLDILPDVSVEQP